MRSVHRTPLKEHCLHQVAKAGDVDVWITQIVARQQPLLKCYLADTTANYEVIVDEISHQTASDDSCVCKYIQVQHYSIISLV